MGEDGGFVAFNVGVIVRFLDMPSKPSKISFEGFYLYVGKICTSKPPSHCEMDHKEKERVVMQKTKVNVFVSIGMLSAVSYLLMLLDFPLPLFPSFLKIDFSDLPALIAAIIMGPASGVMVELFKNLLDLITTGSITGVPVGHIANFVTGTIFILVTYFIYKKVESKKGMTMALLAATIVTALVMTVLNYYIFLPMYLFFMDIHLPKSIAVSAILPFNLVKGFIMTAVFMLLFTKMQGWISKQRISFR